MEKLLVVDMTTKSYKIEEITQAVLDNFLGGRGLGAYLLYRNLQAGVDPLSPDNVLIFSTGPVQGTGGYYSSRAVLNTKSPLTGIYLYSVASGSFGHDIKRAGYMSIMIKGRSAEPTYLLIADEKIEFRSAQKSWGLKTVEAQRALLDDAMTPEASCVCIGPAGERIHPMAVVVTEGEKVRSFGRGGPGAVMGSKNLKGIVVAGSREVNIFDKEAFSQLKEVIQGNVKANSKWADNWKRHGTPGDTIKLNELGILPTRNWQTGVFGAVKKIAPSEFEGMWPRKNVSCGPYCINPCGHFTHIDRGPWKGAKVEGPEYETLYAFGTDCSVDQFDAIVAAEQICDEYGIDTISCGATIAFAMECYEKGLISEKDVAGLDLRFGNAEAMVKATEMIATGTGIAALFGEGVKQASGRIAGSEQFAIHCKGLELGGYECRGMWGQALQFALASRGGCHHAYGLPARAPAEQEAGTQVSGKGNLVKNAASGRILYDCAVMCSFTRVAVGMDNNNLAGIINSVSGKTYTVEDLMRIGLRTMNLERMFNVREGLVRKDDYLPKRLIEEPLPDGPHKGSVVPIDDLLDEGYQALGWDKETGVPLKETLEALDLAELCR